MTTPDPTALGLAARRPPADRLITLVAVADPTTSAIDLYADGQHVARHDPQYLAALEQHVLELEVELERLSRTADRLEGMLDPEARSDRYNPLTDGSRLGTLVAGVDYDEARCDLCGSSDPHEHDPSEYIPDRLDPEQALGAELDVGDLEVLE